MVCSYSAVLYTGKTIGISGNLERNVYRAVFSWNNFPGTSGAGKVVAASVSLVKEKRFTQKRKRSYVKKIIIFDCGIYC